MNRGPGWHRENILLAFLHHDYVTYRQLRHNGSVERSAEPKCLGARQCFSVRL